MIKLSKISNLKIVSSGYSDRFVMSDTFVILEKNNIRFRIDDIDKVPFAYMMLNGDKMDDSNALKNALNLYLKTKSTQYLYYKTIKNQYNEHIIYQTTHTRIKAAIEIATGFRNISDHGIQEFEKIRPEITEQDWDAVEYGLNKINETHLKEGKPIVSFLIPKR